MVVDGAGREQHRMQIGMARRSVLPARNPALMQEKNTLTAIFLRG
jgi:hypothetical protein